MPNLPVAIVVSDCNRGRFLSRSIGRMVTEAVGLPVLSNILERLSTL